VNKKCSPITPILEHLTGMEGVCAGRNTKLYQVEVPQGLRVGFVFSFFPLLAALFFLLALSARTNNDSSA
jgi:hypothetical protein